MTEYLVHHTGNILNRTTPTEEAKVPQALHPPSTDPNRRKVRTKAGAKVQRENPIKGIHPRRRSNNGQAPGLTRTSRAMNSVDDFTWEETAQETAIQADPTVAQSSSKMGTSATNTTEELTASITLDNHSILWVPKAPQNGKPLPTLSIHSRLVPTVRLTLRRPRRVPQAPCTLRNSTSLAPQKLPPRN